MELRALKILATLPYINIPTEHGPCLSDVIPYCSLPFTCWQVDFYYGKSRLKISDLMLEAPSPSLHAQLSQFHPALTFYQTVFLPNGDSLRLFTNYNPDVTLNEDERCAGSVIAVCTFLRTAY